MDEKTLRVFATIVDKGSLTAAADALGYTQPAVTHMLNNFEQNLGFKVLIRDKKGARLTPDGERIMPAVYDHLYAIDNFKEKINAVRQRSEQRVSLHTVRNLSIDWLEDVIMRFGIDYPEIKFDLREGSVAAPGDLLSDGETNFAIVVNDGSFEYSESISRRKLYDDEIMVLMPVNHELAHLDVFPLEEFGGRWFVTQPGLTGYFFNKHLTGRGIVPIEKANSTNDINLISRVYS
ncbi:MAG: LysR family transcriptional regulator, partial [Anaerovoracaceae bacterium]|nr:LysR family transcriptional regulator [Anaerovoracaceae bacterium]